ncbi:MAG: hypothetical protein SFU83_07740 [Meiothermus sp.]|nr:hypothetical protein [Meiothermus sp.]
MKRRLGRYFWIGAVVTAGELFGMAVGDLISFQSGTAIKSADVNSNFTILRTAVAALEANGSVTASRLATAVPPTDGQVLSWNGSSLAWATPSTTPDNGTITGAMFSLPLSASGSRGNENPRALFNLTNNSSDSLGVAILGVAGGNLWVNPPGRG